MSGPTGKPLLWKNCIILDKCRILCMAAGIIINSKIMPRILKIQPVGIIIPYLNFLKSVWFADVKPLQADNIHVDKIP